MPGQRLTRINGAEIAWFEWGTEGDPVVFLSHATGLHSRCWDETVRHLDGFHVIAADHRGHGRSSNNPPFGWDQFGSDLIDLIVALDLRDVHGVGHSMGGHCMVQTIAAAPERLQCLTLFDPVIFEPSIYAMHRMSPEAHYVAKRRNVWDSPEQMIDAFKERMPFSRWHPQVLSDYCRYGLVRQGDAFRLACPPEIEAQIYASSLDFDIYGRMVDVDQPVTIVRAEARGFEAAARDFSLSPTWPELASRFRRGRDIYLPEFSHFLPMENPALAASIIAGRM